MFSSSTTMPFGHAESREVPASTAPSHSPRNSSPLGTRNPHPPPRTTHAPPKLGAHHICGSIRQQGHVLQFRQVAVRIVHNTIPLIDRRLEVEEAVIDGIGDRPGEYEVRIDEPQNSASWFITIDGPHGRWNYDFNPQEQDPNFVRNKIDDALPRDVPTSARVLCDDCIIRGITMLGMNGPVTIHFRAGARIDGYICRDPSCGRAYHKYVGYFSVNQDGSLTRRRALPRCGCQEGSVMYIEAAPTREAVRYRCPTCNAYRPEPFPFTGAIR